MGKKSQTGRKSIQPAKKKTLEKRRQNRKKAKMIRMAAITVAIALLIALIVVGINLVSDRAEKSGYFLRRSGAVSTDTTQIDCAMLQIYMYEYINDYVASTFPNCGFVVGQPLENQIYSTDGRSWRDYFLSVSKSTAKEYASLVSAADVAGFSLTVSEIKAVEEKVALLDESDFGVGINKEDLLRAYKYSTLALKYKATVECDFTMTDSEIDEEYRSDKTAYETASFRSFSVKYKTGDDGQTSDNKTDNLETIYHYPDRENARLNAEDLALMSCEEDFVKWVTAYNATVIEGVLPDTEKAVKKVSEYHYDKDDGGFSEWAFASGRKTGETFLIEDEENSCFIVYYLTDLPHKDETPTANIRYILLMEKYTGLSEAGINALLEELRARYENGEQFGMLALAYSNDNDTAFMGGAVENLIKGEMPDELDEWCFDPERKPGDIGIVKAEYGWHLVLYEGEGIPTYRARVLNTLREEHTDSTINGILTLYKATVNENYLNLIK